MDIKRFFNDGVSEKVIKSKDFNLRFGFQYGDNLLSVEQERLKDYPFLIRNSTFIILKERCLCIGQRLYELSVKQLQPVKKLYS